MAERQSLYYTRTRMAAALKMMTLLREQKEARDRFEQALRSLGVSEPISELLDIALESLMEDAPEESGNYRADYDFGFLNLKEGSELIFDFDGNVTVKTDSFKGSYETAPYSYSEVQDMRCQDAGLLLIVPNKADLPFEVDPRDIVRDKVMLDLDVTAEVVRKLEAEFGPDRI